jgi:SAM-dependent methyltransferase
VNRLKRLADNSSPGSLATKLRRRRFAFFRSLLNKVKPPASILDVGGTQQFWDLMLMESPVDVNVTLLNLSAQTTNSARFTRLAGDARDLSRFEAKSFDVVFSNSVIEHLGPHFEDQKRMADEIRRVGKRYFIQTPNRYFFLEPHFLTPGFQFLPLGVRIWLVSSFNVGWYKRIPDKAAARREVESVLLLSTKQVRQLFPEAKIYREKLFGLTKSIIAYHGW